MRTLEICTQRIFNNLIKQNQNLASDFVLKQSTTVSSAQSPASKTQHTTSNVQRPPSNIQRRDSTVQDPASRVQRRESSVESPASSVQSPEFSVQRPESRVQCPGPSVQSPACRVQRPILAFRVQEFRYAQNRGSIKTQGISTRQFLQKYT